MKASFNMILSTLCGMLPAGIVATVYCAVANFRANDGPYFAPPLMALLIVIPVALFLVPLQGAALAWHRVTGRTTLRGGCTVGAIGGLVTGLTVAFGLFSVSPQSPGTVLGFAGMGLVQGCATLGCLAYLLQMSVRTG
jgi:hypothetical protein